jgi:hypothetical protein
MTPEVLQAKIEARVARLQFEALRAACEIASAQHERRIRYLIDAAARDLARRGIAPPARFLRPRLRPPQSR